LHALIRGVTILKLVSPLLFAAYLAGQVPAGLAPFSTFLKANSSVQQIATDAQGFIYVCGVTSTFPSSSPDSSPAVFVLKLNPAATALVYTVQLPGPAPSYPAAMAVDAAGNAYVAGYNGSGSVQIPFVAKLNTSGDIAYLNQFSNGAQALPQSIAVDGSGNVIVSGGTSGAGFPVTAGAYNNAWTTSPPFIAKIDPTGSKLVFSAVGVGGSSSHLPGRETS
jgi:hypothetical protein